MNEVSVWRPTTKAEADIVVAKLKSEGIDAYVMGALDRSYYPMGQVNVMVPEADADRALELIESHDLELEAQPDSVPPLSRHRSRRAGLVMMAVWLIPIVATLAYGMALLVRDALGR